MWEAMWWGLVGGLALVVGAVVGLVGNPRPKVIALVMAFGSGVLISALAFELAAQAFTGGGALALAAGLAAGSAAFYLGDLVIDRRGGEHRKRSDGRQRSGAALAIVLGSLLDGIPESAAIGVSLLDGGTVGAAVVAAVFLSNVPESMSAASGLRKAGHSTRWILGLWAGVAAVSALAAGLGYATLGGASRETVAAVQAFAAGAILTMLADTMMPEAFENGGNATGVVATFGFTTAFLVSHLA
ncbi:ZIP family metal transporter [Actinokineospora xionganensis]|uniref:ZIP family zinc transporter n=1 Tax=Actinokineospora xionganensis TaxID=2684470 RepID=A0ABR7LAV6_9PSEU|nr:ZIP family zinc transporter [Actinokineospora xionganensis]MBC6449851.1 ZIP family zinc transporter [Actinokineospora xionganensis]